MSVKIPPRPQQGNKKTFGTVALFGGYINESSIMTGGIALSAQAALRSGVGMAVFIGETSLTTELIRICPQAIGVGISEIKNTNFDWHALVIGPGLSVKKEHVQTLEYLLQKKIPTVIDADGLNLLARYPELASFLHERCVLTPHMGELQRLLAAFNCADAADLSKILGCVVVAKNASTEVFAPKIPNWKLDNPTPVLATAGSGDVLAGIIGGLLAQFGNEISAFDCAKIGVIIHNKLGHDWQKKSW